MITGIIIAAVLVGGTGLIIGLLLGVAGKKFAVEVNEKEVAVRSKLPEITAAAVDIRDVTVWQLPLQQVRLLSTDVR